MDTELACPAWAASGRLSCSVDPSLAADISVLLTDHTRLLPEPPPPPRTSNHIAKRWDMYTVDITPAAYQCHDTLAAVLGRPFWEHLAVRSD